VTSKIHLAITAEGHVVASILTGGNTSDISMGNALTSDVVGCYILEDMGYDSDPHRDFLRSQNNVPVIPGRKHRKTPVIYDKIMYKLRKNIEIFFGKIKENKRLSMRFDKEDRAFMSIFAIAAIKIFLKIKIS
jgi:transposase